MPEKKNHFSFFSNDTKVSLRIFLVEGPIFNEDSTQKKFDVIVSDIVEDTFNLVIKN